VLGVTSAAKTVKVAGDWETMVRKALEKKKPPGGWPEPEGKKGEKP